MSRSGRLAIRPECCNRCGRCVRACPQGLIRVGGGYVYVDVASCSGCYACIESCDQGAIVTAEAATAAAKATVVVGSRAEAKALREATRTGGAKATKAPKVAKPAKPVKSAKPATADKPARAVSKRERVQDRDSVAWSLTEAGSVAAVLLALLLLKDSALSSTILAVMPPGGRVAARGVVLAGFYAAQLALLLVLARRRGLRFADAFRITPVRGIAGTFAAAGLVIALLVATRAASTAWGALAQALSWPPPGSGTLTGVFGGGPGGLVLAFVMAGVLGPLTEEIVFRGVITSALNARYGRYAAIVVSSALFALYHVTPWLWVPMFVFGAALSWLSLSRSTLIPAITLHALYNGVVVGAAFWLAR